MTTEPERLVVILEAQSKRLQNQLTAASRQIDRFARQTEARFSAMQRSIDTSFLRLPNIAVPLAGTLGAREVIAYSDAWTSASNKIAAAASTSGMLARPIEAVKDAANDARADLASYVDLYSRLLRVAPAVAASEEQVARATEIVAKSLKAGGASAQEQAAALIQLSQALGSGVLQGDELRSLRENAPLLAQAIADEFNVTVGALKDLGARGELEIGRVFNAILKAGPTIEKAFASTTSTIGDAIGRIENELAAYIGNSGEASGATQGLIDALNFLADHFQETADVVVQFATVLGGALAGRALVGVALTAGQAVGAITAFVAALRTGAVAAGGFTAALGPIGLLVGGAAAAVLLFANAQDEAERATAEHTASMRDNAKAIDLAKGASEQYRQALRDQIAMQVEAARAALTEADAQTVAARARAAANVFEVAGVEFHDPFAAADADAKLKKSLALDGALQQLEAQLAEIDRIMGTPAGPGDGTGSGSGSGKQNEYEKAVESIKKRTAALQAETAAQATLNPLINDYGLAVETAKAKQDLLYAAQEAGLTITPELRAAIDSLAAGYAQASVEAQKLAESQDKARANAEMLRDVSKDVFRGFIDDMVAGKSAADILANSLGKIGDKLLEIGLDTLLGGGGNKDNPFGLISSLVGLPRREHGGPARAGQPYVVGERRAELFVPSTSGTILPRVPDARSLAPSGGVGAITIDARTTIIAPNADAAGLARLEAMIRQRDAELPSRVVKAVRDAKSARALRG